MKILIEVEGIEDVMELIDAMLPTLKVIGIGFITIMWLVIMGVLLVEGWKWWKTREGEHG
jgi:predicted negative regulator of RcsB-dependent stress response